jgi:hypothetical protein
LIATICHSQYRIAGEDRRNSQQIPATTTATSADCQSTARTTAVAAADQELRESIIASIADFLAQQERTEKTEWR